MQENVTVGQLTHPAIRSRKGVSGERCDSLSLSERAQRDLQNGHVACALCSAGEWQTKQRMIKSQFPGWIWANSPWFSSTSACKKKKNIYTGNRAWKRTRVASHLWTSQVSIYPNICRRAKWDLSTPLLSLHPLLLKWTASGIWNLFLKERVLALQELPCMGLVDKYKIAV